MVKKLLESLTKLQTTNKTEFNTGEVIKRKVNQLYVKWKG